MFYDIPCLDDEGYDVAMMTEILPQWNNDILSLIINPEALLFANPISTITCSADAAAASFGMPLNALFWCMGSWGNAYPLSGSITSTDYVEANAGIAARTIYMMGRLGLLWNTSDDGCYRELAPIWRKDRFKLQMMRPARSTTCLPIGREGLLWTGGKHDPRKDNFMWMMFEKKTAASVIRVQLCKRICACTNLRKTNAKPNSEQKHFRISNLLFYCVLKGEIWLRG